jgi:cytochrome c
MFWRLSLMLVCSLHAQKFGKPISADEAKKRDLTVFADGRGLPPGKGDAKSGAAVYAAKCAECHNDRGEGRERQYPALVGGIGSLGTPKPKKSVGSYWPYATTLWDHINRAMPFDHPRSLSPDEVYSVTAFVLFLNGILPESQELNEKTLPKVNMPNRHGFIPPKRP